MHISSVMCHRRMNMVHYNHLINSLSFVCKKKNKSYHLMLFAFIHISAKFYQDLIIFIKKKVLNSYSFVKNMCIFGEKNEIGGINGNWNLYCMIYS